jgi:hypothetical protein
MRTILRIGVIAVATGAVVVYLATSYALHHPESVLAQCTMTGLQLTAGFHPVYHAGAAAGRMAYRIAGGQSTSVQLTPEEEEQLLCVPPDPLPVEEAAPLEPTPVFSDAQRDFILQTIKEELQRHRQTREDAAPNGLTQTRLKPVSEVEPPIAKEEDDFPNTMPHCLDAGEQPDLMPPAEDSTSTTSTNPLFEFWLGLFESAAEESKERFPYFHDEEPPQCLEDPTYQYQYPGCPYTGKSPQEEKSGTPKMTKPVPTIMPRTSKKPQEYRTPTVPPIRDGAWCDRTPDEVVVLQALPHSVRDSLSEQQLSDSQIVCERLVDKIDPVHFFPFIGPAEIHRCLWKCTVYYCDTVPGAPEGSGAKKVCNQVVYIDNTHFHSVAQIDSSGNQTNGKADSPVANMIDPKKYELPARLRQNLPGDSTEAQEEPAHPDVDTTEFRPSDAHPGEFDPKPM